MPEDQFGPSRRVGIHLTVAQRSEIAALRDAGDTLGAQRLVLAEIDRQFGDRQVD